MSADQVQVFVIVLAGGEGKRLSPLTLDRAKPAVPFGGNYRLIDFALSNWSTPESGDRALHLVRDRRTDHRHLSCCRGEPKYRLSIDELRRLGVDSADGQAEPPKANAEGRLGSLVSTTSRTRR